MKKDPISLTYRKCSFKDEDFNDKPSLPNLKKSISFQEKEIEKDKDKDKAVETYFDTSESDCDFYLNSQQVLIEKTSDNTYGRFDELIGSGTFKNVYRGYDFNSGREIAWSIINVASSDSSDKPSSLKKITEEINILKQLDHPNLIHFINGWYDEAKNQIIIITELVSGGSLRSNLKRIKEPRLRLVKKWIREMLSGLEYLHNKNIIHRDIKCDNIFLDSIKGTLKIGDLGGSQLLVTQYATQYIGTEEFMSPEVYEGKYTVKADIYSLGMSIIEMLTLEKPYKECEGPMAIYYNITHGIFPESLAKIEDEKVTNLIKLCLLRETERPSATELLKNEFLNDTTSEENNIPVRIINHLRQKIISNKEKAFDMGVVSNLGLTKPKLDSIKIDESYTSTSPVSSPSHIRHTHSEKDRKSNFIITIKDPQEINRNNNNNADCNENQTNNNEHFNSDQFERLHSLSTTKINKEVEINFIVKRDEWKNKKLLKCSYNLDNDTVDGLASELQKAIDLNEEECQIVKQKLNESLTHYTSNSNCSSQRNTMIPVTDESKDKDSKQKCRFHCFLSSFNALSDNIRKLLNDDEETKLLEKLGSVHYKSDQMTPELINIVESFKSRRKLLMNIIDKSVSSSLSSCK